MHMYVLYFVNWTYIHLPWVFSVLMNLSYLMNLRILWSWHSFVSKEVSALRCVGSEVYTWMLMMCLGCGCACAYVYVLVCVRVLSCECEWLCKRECIWLIVCVWFLWKCMCVSVSVCMCCLQGMWLCVQCMSTCMCVHSFNMLYACHL